MMQRCYLCESEDIMQVGATVRDNPDLDVCVCQECGLFFLSSFDHIDNDTYANSGMHAETSTIDSWMRETADDDQRRYHFCIPVITDKHLMDFGCGNGGFLKLAKGRARSVLGVDLEKALSVHFNNEGIPFVHSLSEVEDRFDVITLFHVLEHLPDPAQTLLELRRFLNPGGQIVIEVPNANDALLTIYQSDGFQKFAFWSFHLFIFNANTLRRLFDKINSKTLYIRHIQRYPLSNHLHWLAKNRPGGHREWHFIDSENLTTAYEQQLAALGITDTLIASIMFKEE